MDERSARRAKCAAPEKGPVIETWQALLRRALQILDFTADWSLGGGTVLMLRYRHRLSKGIDISVSDRRTLGLLAARLRDEARAEEPGLLKLYLPEGEIDFVVAARITADAVRLEKILGREIRIETSAEIVAKKIWHRAARFSARDLVDLAVVAKREPGAVEALEPVLAARRATLLERLARHEAALREDFAALDMLEFRASFDECLELAREMLEPRRAEEPRAQYRFVSSGLALAGLG